MAAPTLEPLDIETSPRQIAAGKELYDKYCSQCHGIAGDARADATPRLKPEVEGLPLAIQLAAASVRAFSAAQILTRMRQNIDVLGPAQLGVAAPRLFVEGRLGGLS